MLLVELQHFLMTITLIVYNLNGSTVNREYVKTFIIDEQAKQVKHYTGVTI